jgi:hypothetical protein
MHQALAELEDTLHRGHYPVAPATLHQGSYVFRASAHRLRRGEAVEAVLVSTVQALTSVLAGGDVSGHAHVLTGLKA